MDLAQILVVNVGASFEVAFLLICNPHAVVSMLDAVLVVKNFAIHLTALDGSLHIVFAEKDAFFFFDDHIATEH